MLYLVLAVLGLGLLTVAADQLVLGAGRLATRLRVSPVVVGVVMMPPLLPGRAGRRPVCDLNAR